VALDPAFTVLTYEDTRPYDPGLVRNPLTANSDPELSPARSPSKPKSGSSQEPRASSPTTQP
jgi:hypothetical protein